MENTMQLNLKKINTYKRKLSYELNEFEKDIEMHNIWYGSEERIDYKNVIDEIRMEYLKDASKRYKNKNYSLDKIENMEDFYNFFINKIISFKKQHRL